MKECRPCYGGRGKVGARKRAAGSIAMAMAMDHGPRA
jgi:hypothetical protein